MLGFRRSLFEESVEGIPDKLPVEVLLILPASLAKPDVLLSMNVDSAGESLGDS